MRAEQPIKLRLHLSLCASNVATFIAARFAAC